jgi:hypothetical protein
VESGGRVREIRTRVERSAGRPDIVGADTVMLTAVVRGDRVILTRTAASAAAIRADTAVLQGPTLRFQSRYVVPGGFVDDPADYLFARAAGP